MKKSILLFFVVLTQAVFSQDFDSVRIYINPGHGGHDSNDRHILDTDFWESEGNLSKGLHLRDILTSYNANIRMSRTTNTTADDKALSVISAEANEFNADYMHSIHSNAYNASSNYTLILYQGTDAVPTYANSKVMGGYLANEITKSNRTTAEYVRGDMSFYGSSTPYLGVFKGLNMPGTLSEGSFHDYVPESWRLRNEKYLDNEAWAIARAFISYYGVTPFSHGILAGLVRDQSKTVSYTVNGSLPNDKYKPINNIKVTLQPGNYVYNGDSYNNGYFMFDSLAPGQYTIYYEADEYMLDSATATVTANNIVFADKFLSYDTTKPPAVTDYLPTAEANTDYVKLYFAKAMNKSSVESAFSVEPGVTGSFTWNDAELSMTFTPTSFSGSATDYTIKLTTDAKSAWNVPLQDTLKFVYHPNVPVVTASVSAGDTISVVQPISFTFTENMMKEAAQGAFSIQPAVEGTLAWSGKSLSFTPKTVLQPATNYTVKISTEAKSLWNIPIASELSLTFTTSERGEYTLVSTYPANNQTDVPYIPQVRLKFDAPILSSSVSGKITFNDANAQSVALANAKIYSDDKNGYITFETKDKLTAGGYYTVHLYSGIKDQSGLPLLDTIEIKFKVTENAYSDLNILDDFETLGSWKDPEYSGSTTGTDSAATTFLLASDKKINGSRAARLDYTFVNDQGGVCRVYDDAKPLVKSGTNEVGAWIYGDLSGNLLEFWFYDENNTNVAVFIDTIDWAGWDYRKTAQIGDAGKSYKFHSLVLKQANGGEKTGAIYFDRLQTDSEIIGTEENDNNLPKAYKLSQNYPNPFNPSTVINFELPKASYVTLKVYDILGREVAILKNETMKAGKHNAVFNAAGLPSGIYIYRLETEDFVKASKMTLIK